MGHLDGLEGTVRRVLRRVKAAVGCVCGGGGSSEELLMACAVFIRSSSGFFGGGGGTIGAVVGAAFHQAVGAVGRFCSSGYRLGWFGDGSIDWG